MFGIFRKHRLLIGRRAARDFNRVAAYLTNLCGDESIDFHRPDEPTADNPPCIAVNSDWIEGKIRGLASSSAAPADVALTAAAGVSTAFARGDHVHKIAANSALKKELGSAGFTAEVGSTTEATGPSTNWQRGETVNNVPRGAKMRFYTRMEAGVGSDAGQVQLFWRWVEWDQNGCIVAVGDEHKGGKASLLI